MNDYYKLYLGILIAWIINVILSYTVNWTIIRNGFTEIALWLMFLILGLIGGRTLTLKEVRK